MVEEPVQNRSGRVMNAKRGFVHQTSSSANRDTCVMASAATARNSIAKSRSDTASSELVHSASKPSSVATHCRSHPVAGAGWALDGEIVAVESVEIEEPAN